MQRTSCDAPQAKIRRAACIRHQTTGDRQQTTYHTERDLQRETGGSHTPSGGAQVVLAACLHETPGVHLAADHPTHGSGPFSPGCGQRRRPCRICTGIYLTHPCHICTGTGGSLLAHLHRDLAAAIDRCSIKHSREFDRPHTTYRDEERDVVADAAVMQGSSARSC